MMARPGQVLFMNIAAPKGEKEECFEVRPWLVFEDVAISQPRDIRNDACRITSMPMKLQDGHLYLAHPSRQRLMLALR